MTIILLLLIVAAIVILIANISAHAKLMREFDKFKILSIIANADRPLFKSEIHRFIPGKSRGMPPLVTSVLINELICEGMITVPDEWRYIDCQCFLTLAGLAKIGKNK